MIISFPLLNLHAYQDSLSYFFRFIPFAAHYFLLNLIVGLLAYCSFFVVNRKKVTFFMIFLFLLVQVILVVDTKIYTIFHYHINPLVLNVLTTEGVSDSVLIGKGTVAIFLFIVTGILCAEIIVHWYFMNITKYSGRMTVLRIKKIAKGFFCVGLFLIAADKAMYAYGDIQNNTAITQNAKLFPLYQPFTVKRFVSNVFNIRVNREDDLKVPVSSTSLRYPKNIIRFDPSLDKKFNVLVIVVDGLRFDMLDRETMPHSWEFGQKNIIFANHYSGGNGTRFGIFSLFYGIDGTYWHNFLARRISPVLVNTLVDKGYDFKILSSTRLTFPEFRKTAFIRIPERIEDSFGNLNAAEKDMIITERFIRYASNSGAEKPFFAFVFYDSSHQPYLYPREFEKFQPAGDPEINYFKDISKESISILKNRYKNAVYYNDYLIGRIIDSLTKNDLLKNTIVVITGDHGEEFYENGYFGHTSSFDDYQVKTVFILHYPGIGHFVNERLTGHADLVPTLMEALGCISSPEDYSHGVSLLSKKARNYITSSNWDTSAIIDDEYKIIFSTEMYNMRSFEVRRKNDYSLVKNQKDVLKEKKNTLIDVALQMSEFYR